MYNGLPSTSRNDKIQINKLYDMWLEGKDSEKCNAVLHTTYHEIEKNVNALNIKWQRFFSIYYKFCNLQILEVKYTYT